MSTDHNFSVVGKSLPRSDARIKAVGAAQYAALDSPFRTGESLLDKCFVLTST